MKISDFLSSNNARLIKPSPKKVEELKPSVEQDTKPPVMPEGKKLPSAELLAKLESLNGDMEKQGDEPMALDPLTGEYISAEEWNKKYDNGKTILEVTIVTPNDDGFARVDIVYMSAAEYLKEFGNVANPPKATIHSKGAQKPTDEDLAGLSNDNNINELHNDDTPKALDPLTGEYIPAEEWNKKYNNGKTILEVTIVTPTDNDMARFDIVYMSAAEYLKEFGNVVNPPKATIHSKGAQKPTDEDLAKFGKTDYENYSDS